MFKIEMISTNSDRVMLEKSIMYTDSLEEAGQLIDERIDLESRNDFVFIEETPDGFLGNITIPEFYVNNKKAGIGDYMEVEDIIQKEKINEAIIDYINEDL